MNKNKTGKSKFKQKAADILNPHSGINNIKEFLETDGNNGKRQNDSSPANVDYPLPPLAQTHIPPSNTSNTDMGENCLADSKNDPPDDRLVRIHVHIRKDLADRLLEETYQRKRSSRISKKEATQRAIIEQALEDYFSKNDKHNSKLTV